jgi:alpha-beta hydrolase superfamily lysophospholipase
MRLYLVIVVGFLAFVARAQEPISFPTQDGGLIQAHLYRAGEHGVILVHGGRFNKESWEKQARALTNAGFTALAIDLRGYGKSKGPGDSDIFTAPLQNDVLAAYNYLHNHGSKKISLLGASLGGGAVAEASTLIDSNDLDAVILLAATPDHPEKMRSRKFFIIAHDDSGSGDIPRLPKFREQFTKAPEPKKLLILDGSAHAQFLFSTPQADRLMREILDFLANN